MSLLRPVALAALAALTLTACAANRRDTFMREHAGSHVYGRACDELWPEVRALLQEKRYSLREGQGEHVIATEWREDTQSNLGSSHSAYVAKGYALSPTACAVSFHKQTRTMTTSASDNNAHKMQSSGSASATRDLAMELELLQRVEPEAYQQLAQQASAENP